MCLLKIFIYFKYLLQHFFTVKHSNSKHSFVEIIENLEQLFPGENITTHN